MRFIKTNVQEITKLFLLSIALYSNAFTQTPDPLSFFPYNTGNMWEYYWVEPGYPDTLQSFMVRDSIGIGGQIYTTKDSRWINPVVHFLTDRYAIDTLRKQVWGNLGYGFGILYKLDAEQGERWVMLDHGVGGYRYEMCRVVSVREATVLGIRTTIKDYLYYLAPDSTDTLGLSRSGQTLASGFGLIYMGGGDLFFYLFLKGAVIDGVLYGDTTRIVTSVPELLAAFPTQLELSPNFPNPFNPSTTISFKLQSSNRISLVIFDALGKEVKTLIDNEWFDFGPHKIMWDGTTDDGRAASSGVYFCRLSGNGNGITRSMILLK
jgi:hypothetical protein